MFTPQIERLSGSLWFADSSQSPRLPPSQTNLRLGPEQILLVPCFFSPQGHTFSYGWPQVWCDWCKPGTSLWGRGLDVLHLKVRQNKFSSLFALMFSYVCLKHTEKQEDSIQAFLLWSGLSDWQTRPQYKTLSLFWSHSFSLCHSAPYIWSLLQTSVHRVSFYTLSSCGQLVPSAPYKKVKKCHFFPLLRQMSE